MKLRWSLAAADDLESISRYLELHYPQLAHGTIARIYSGAKSLTQFPRKGRQGSKAATRELILAPLPYLIIYAIEEERVHLLRILHSSQNRE